MRGSSCWRGFAICRKSSMERTPTKRQVRRMMEPTPVKAAKLPRAKARVAMRDPALSSVAAALPGSVARFLDREIPAMNPIPENNSVKPAKKRTVAEVEDSRWNLGLDFVINCQGWRALLNNIAQLDDRIALILLRTISLAL
jgi:hypothetical protein